MLFLWVDKENVGFLDIILWLKVIENYKDINV